MTTATQKKHEDDEPEILTIPFNLRELPSSQHRAGLAGLVLMVNWRNEQEDDFKQGTLRIEDLNDDGLTLVIDEVGVAELLNLTYAAAEIEDPRDKPFKNKKKEIVEPLRTEEREVEDKKGSKKQKTFYIYKKVVPKGAFLEREDESGLWIKLWRDVVWSVLRGVPAQRNQYEARAEKKVYKDIADSWKMLKKPNGVEKLSSAQLLGSQATNAEKVSFQDRSRFYFLLNFWPLMVQIYVPEVINQKGEGEFAGYVLAIPDVSHLESFCDEWLDLLRSRSMDKRGYRPKAAVIDLPLEGALDFCHRIRQQVRERVEHLEGEKRTEDLVLAFDVLHADKRGNSINVISTTRLSPDELPVDEYRQLKNHYRELRFRQTRLHNFIEKKPWFHGFDKVFGTVPYDQTIGNKWFRIDVRTAFKEEGGILMNKENTEKSKEQKEKKPSTDEQLIYRAVQSYVLGKTSSKDGLEWQTVQGKEGEEKKFREAKGKIAKHAFLAVRSRGEAADFQEFFASTICSVPQRMNEADFLKLSAFLIDNPQKARTLTLLALSVNG